MVDPVSFTQMAGIFIVKYIEPTPCFEVLANIMVRIADNRNTDVPGRLCLAR
jgi:hypothetical protein